jgi:hypothetical protein
MLHNEPLLDRANHRLQRLELSCQYDQARTGINGQTGILFVRVEYPRCQCKGRYSVRRLNRETRTQRQHEEMEGAAQRRLSETGRAANARTLRSNLPDL